MVRQTRATKRNLALAADAVMLPLVMYLSFTIRLGSWHPGLSSDELWLLIATPLLSLPLLYLSKVYRTVIRFFNSDMLWRIFGVMSLVTVLLATRLFWHHGQSVSGSTLLVFWAFSLLYLGGSRFLVKRYLYWVMRLHDERVPVAVYGAGDCGVQLVLGLSAAFDYRPVVFVDDAPDLAGSIIHGVPVIGRQHAACQFRRHRIKLALVAMPSISRSKWQEIVLFLEGLGVGVKTVPSLPDVVSGRARIQDVRDVSIDDLLGREPVAPDRKLLQAAVTGRVVMVTGAGGSIGGELCRQILAQAPSTVVLFERNEYALYAIDQELRQWLVEHAHQTRLVTVLGNVTRRKQVEQICRAHNVATIFHAAAYKHVPLIEANPVDGVFNNVFGTVRTALAAKAAGVERFVLISTDKAVRATNVMGATKRLAEMALQALAEQGGETVFTMVRFGNVLGSSGSVVPLFRNQILAGGPVTLTHTEVTRYFMTIPEAAQLVIQAGAMAHGGEVFVLDMGEPIKIKRLAQRMIRLMGCSIRDADNPDGDIEIRVTGLRSGEKLYEELLVGHRSAKTSHPRIQQAQEDHKTWATIEMVLAALNQTLQQDDHDKLRMLLQKHVDGYQPGNAGKKPVEDSKQHIA